jgi:phage tail sheath gpL-like
MYSLSASVSKLSLITLSAFLLSVSACSKNEDKPKTEYTVSASADGAQETPAVTTSATGSVTGTYNKTTKVLTYTATWSGLSGAASDMHFHGPALAGTPAGVAVAITGFTSGVSGTFSSTATLTDAQELDLLAGKWYYNVHTPDHPAGEIRGQLSVQ